MKQVLGVTFNEKAGQQTVGVYVDENGAECFVTDEPYLLSDGTSLTEPLPIRIVDGPYDTNAPLMMIQTPSEGGGVARTLDIAGPELVTNGEFASDIVGWTDGSNAGGAISHATNALRTTNTSGTARARQQVTVETGKRYAFAVQNVGSPSVAGSISLGTSEGGTQYTVAGGTTNPAIAQRLGIAEITAISTAAHIQMSAPIAGSLDWDHVTIRELTGSQFLTGRIFEDAFSVDGPIIGRLTPDGLPYRLIQTVNGAQVIPDVIGGKMVVTANASGQTASYPYLDLGDGKVTGIHCDLAWTDLACGVAMISVAKTGSRLLISDITTNSLHIVFNGSKVDITTYVAGVTTTETVNYSAPAVADARAYPDVGWFIDGSTLTVKLPDGSTIQRSDAEFAQVAGGCGVIEHFYGAPPSGSVAIDKIAIRLT